MEHTRPSALLLFDIAADQVTDEARDELKRCYSHVCPNVIRTHEGDGPEHRGNIARVMINLEDDEIRYLHSEDEGSDLYWNEVLEGWIGALLHKIGSNMKTYNRRQKLAGRPQLDFEWLEFELAGGGDLAIAIHLDSNDSVDTEMKTIFSAVRTALNDGAFGEDKTAVTRVSLPSPESFAEQQTAFEEQAAAEAEEQAPAEATESEDGAEGTEMPDGTETETEAVQDASERPVEDESAGSPDDEFVLTAEEAEAEELAEEEARASDGWHSMQSEDWLEEWQRRYTFPELDYNIDFTVWGIDYADGTSKQFDSAAGELIS